MAHFLGIDVGTSALKAVICDEAQMVVAETSMPLPISRPRALWSEQDPGDWVKAAEAALDHFHKEARAALADVTAIGLSGQMHGATLLDAADTPLRPCILWNDGRAHGECDTLAAAFPSLADIAGVMPMPGFTAPKLMWVARHEPEVFKRVRKVLLPKDYLRLWLTGEHATDMSDAAGTWWLDEARRDWSRELIAATGMKRTQLPRLVEGTAVSGSVRAELTARWGLRGDVIVAGGAGDAAAGAAGLGAIEEGAAFISLGTSGQLFVTNAAYKPAVKNLVHAFAHCVPGRWFQMAAMLNGASCLAFTAGLLHDGVGGLVAEAQEHYKGPGDLIFLPYLAGERTPHNDAHARGVFFGLTPDTSRAGLMQATMEGLAFSFADALSCVEAAGSPVASAAVIGGGAQSAFLVQLLANVLDRPLHRYKGGEKGPAFGAARLARIAATGETPQAVCTLPPVQDTTLPDARLVAAYKPRVEQFRRLYKALKPEFPLIGAA